MVMYYPASKKIDNLLDEMNRKIQTGENKMSDVKLNVEKFKELIEKGTLAHSIECLQLHFVEDRVKSNMVSNQRDVVVLLDMNNDVIEFSDQDDITFNFAEPYIQILPYFTVIDEAEAQIEIIDENENFIIKSGNGQISKVPFCHLSSIQNNVLYKSPKDDFDYFATIVQGFATQMNTLSGNLLLKEIKR